MKNLNPSSCWGYWFSSCILLVFLTTLQQSCSSSAARFLGNETDRMALLDIKLQINDPNGLLSSWNDSQHHCQWPGVSCNRQHGRVTNLTLQGMSLSGTISPHIGNLSFVNVIRLAGNGFHGEIPQQIGQLSRLRFFNLSYNLLSGKIPINLSKCSNLSYIDMASNHLIGEIPSELGFLTKLEYLRLASNNLTGKIPASLGNLSSSLTSLSIGYNNLEGNVPDELSSLSRLGYLGLGPNKLSGEMPSFLFNMSTLTDLVVADNLLSGKLPTDLGFTLPNLQTIAIGINDFSGEIPVSITNCTKLEQLDLSDNKFDGKVPPGIGQLLNLQWLNIFGNSLNGNVPDILLSLTNCTKLGFINFSFNKFSGELPKFIGNLSSQLTNLYLSNNEITGILPIEIGNLVSLKGLVLQYNSLTGIIPADLAKLKNLQSLVLSMNMFSGQIPPALCINLTNLYYIGLSDNNLGGDLGYSLANCRSLQLLNIPRNKLSGIIPAHIFGSFISPIQFDLSNNSLSGTLPIEIGKLANLRVLYVSDNKLSGDIPSTIGDCSALVKLYMNSNQFTGSLPPTLATLKGIEELDLSDNTFTGPIPRGLSQLVYLTYLNLSYNNFEGEVPVGGVFSNASRIMLQGNSKLCGGISELGLPSCPIVHINKKGTKHLKVILIPLLSVLVISTILFLYLFLRKKSDGHREEMPQNLSEKMLRVSYHDLYRATNEFSPVNLIGSGGFGYVYKGNLVLENGDIKVVAVKVLDLQKRGASKSFKAECDALSNLRHRNMVPLLTYCSSIDHKGSEFKALVYNYMENGSLDMWLHLEHEICLNLLQRLNIAIDIASALEHLHNHSHTVVAHCDVKPSNVLLDDEFTAYVSDFGLARLILPLPQREGSSSTFAIKGTIGYAAPEYAMGLEVSTKGDVYSYGILLLEMFTGRRPTDEAFTDGLDLHNYVKEGLPDQVWEIVDPSLLSGINAQLSQTQAASKDGDTKECLVSVLNIGIECSKPAAKDRMDMAKVTRELHFIRDALRAR